MSYITREENWEHFPNFQEKEIRENLPNKPEDKDLHNMLSSLRAAYITCEMTFVAFYNLEIFLSVDDKCSKVSLDKDTERYLNMIQFSLSQTVTLNITSLFDNDKRSVNIERPIEYIHENIENFKTKGFREKVIKNFKEEYSENKEKVENNLKTLKALRDKCLAHNDIDDDNYIKNLPNYQEINETLLYSYNMVRFCIMILTDREVDHYLLEKEQKVSEAFKRQLPNLLVQARRH